MFLNFAIVAIVMCITSQDVQGNDCPFSDDDVKVDKRKCQRSLNAGFALCCNFTDSVIAYDKCENISEKQELFLSITVDLHLSDKPCYLKSTKNFGLIDSALEKIFRQTFADNNQTLASFKAVHNDNFNIKTGYIAWRLIFSEVINTNITEEVALAVLAIEKKRVVIILGFNITFRENIGIFTVDPTHSSLYSRNYKSALDWCSSSRLNECPLNTHCKNTGVRYACFCDNNLVPIGNICAVPVQLIFSAVPHQGWLEYYSKKVWHSVCSDKFRAPEARVVCRQLGFDGRDAYIYTDANITRHPAMQRKNAVSIYNFRCSGKENSLMDCTKVTRSSCCSEADHVYVKCNTECPDDNHYGPNCTQTCDCLRNNTEFCNRQSGSCVCSAGWRGKNCTDDVDECVLGRHNCTRFNEQCENIAGGFRCVCKPETMRESGYCVGNITSSDPLPFKSNGSQDITLSCNQPNNTSELRWKIHCSKTSSTTCTFKPQPYQDGYTITCYAYPEYSFSGERIIFIAQITLELQYPPSEPPKIDGYENGQVMNAGEYLRMNCTVEGGKPRVRAVNFSCPGHPSHTDVKSMNYIQSVLEFLPVRAEDDGITCTCSAEWEDPTFYNLIATRVLTVNAPPSKPPEIKGYENGQVVQAGKYLRMTCTVEGGKPRITAVNFSCPGHPDATDVNTESVLLFSSVRAEDDGITCTCSAEWEDPTLYNLTATRVLRVIGTNDLPYLNGERVAEAFGVGTAVIVCVVIIVFGVWKYKQQLLGIQVNTCWEKGNLLTDFPWFVLVALLIANDEDPDRASVFDWRRTYDNLIRKYIGRYGVFAHFFRGDDTTEDYAEIDDDMVEVEDSDRTDQGYSRPLSDPLPRSCTSMATIPLSVENELTTVAFVQEDKSDTGYFFGTYSVSATEDSGKIETLSSQDSNDDKLEASRESNISMTDSDRPSRKDYLHPARTMSLSDEIHFPECNYSQSLEVHGGEKKDYLYPTSDMSLPDEIPFPKCEYSQSLEVHEGGEKKDYLYPTSDMSLPDEIPFPKCEYSQSLEVHEGDKKDYLHPTSDMSLPDELTSPECSPAENINKKN